MNIASLVKAVPDVKYMFLNKYRTFTIRNEPSESDNMPDTHNGGVRGDRRITDEAITILKKADILFDTSGRGTNIPLLIELFGKTKIAFGSHSPLFDYLTARLRYESLKEEDLDSETKNLIRSENARRLLGL